MRYGLISDIHGNYEALDVVLQLLSKEDIGEYICIGDVVGYGADPHACIKMVKALKPKALIAGNHEWGVLGLLGLDYFNEYAQEAIRWTARELNDSEIDYLRTFKLSCTDIDYTAVHGSLNDPESFHYIFDADDACRTMEIMTGKICFVGHSHVAGIFSYDGRKAFDEKGMKARMKDDRRYVVNIGSVGQPRDGDVRASCAIYDSTEGTLEIRRVQYDVASAQKSIICSGLPRWLAQRLSQGR